MLAGALRRYLGGISKIILEIERQAAEQLAQKETIDTHTKLIGTNIEELIGMKSKGVALGTKVIDLEKAFGTLKEECKPAIKLQSSLSGLTIILSLLGLIGLGWGILTWMTNTAP